MNQTKKRLSIINLAISIGDVETIQLQMLRLSPLKNDLKIQEILHGLQSENYAQTQHLITAYIESPDTGIHQRTIEEEKEPTPEEAEAIIEEFDLFTIPDNKEEETREIDTFDEILDVDSSIDTPSPTKEYQEPNKSDLDSLLNLTSDDIQTNQVDLSHPATYKDDFFETQEIDEEDREESYDDFFSANETPTLQEEVPTVTQKEYDETSEKCSMETDAETHYDPIPYINQKLSNMLTQYPPQTEAEADEHFESVERWLQQISQEGYTEAQIEEMMEHIQKLTQENRKAEAAQLLLISAATQSLFAHFMLARSLFKGDLLEQNLPEAFTLINRLAMDEDYPEAICDLGQLYENGLGITKDKKRAEELYKEAMEMGIKRAKPHYERLYEENNGLFSFLKR